MNRIGAGCVALTLLSGHPVSAQAARRACPAALPSHVRILDCRLADALTDGLERSPTLRQLVDRIAALNGVVYVTFEPLSTLRKNLLGALSEQVTIAGAVSILRATVRRNSGDEAVAMLAHEFRHALEVLEHGARTEAEFRALFKRIGTQVAPNVFETEAAIAAERSVRRELLDARPR